MTDQTKTDEAKEAAEKLRYSRGAQLRALIVSWYSGDTYQRALQEQAQALQDEELEISDDWGEMAEHILQQFSQVQNRPRLAGPDGRPIQ